MMVSDDISERAFGFAEVPDPSDKKNGDQTTGEHDGKPVQWHSAAEKGPTKTFDDADHRVQRIDQAPFCRYNRTAEADGRNVESKLDDERDDVPEVAVFDIQSAQPQANPKSRSHR